MTEPLSIGVDAGTGGIRVLAVDPAGTVAARASASLPADGRVQRGPLHDQSPEAWWETFREALVGLTAGLRDREIPPEALSALAVDGTSGTLVCLDRADRPVRPAMMYNDTRAVTEAEELNTRSPAFRERLGYRFEASFALSKILYLKRREPDSFARTARFLDQAGYLAGRLTGDLSASDYSNALKTGYDLIDDRWPDWMSNLPGIPERLPRIVAPGVPIGRVSASAAAETGLPAGLPVVAGATDGTAACLASGLRRPGDCNTTLGTTLVFKGLSCGIVRHPAGLIYSHKLPGGLWLPGAASHTGGEWIESGFAGSDLRSLDGSASGLLPTDRVAYPLVRRGERFPFAAPEAEGFCLPAPGGDLERYAACLQGTAYVERLAYEVLDETCGVSGGEVYGTGGGSRSDVWMQCRADATGRVLHRPACPESAFGSALLAAAGVGDGDVWKVVRERVRIDRTFAPDPARAERYDAGFDRFRGELVRRGYL